MKKAIFGVFALALTGCATSTSQVEDSSRVADPYEGFNRSMYAFNDGLDRAVLQPVSKAYTAVTPQFGRDRVSDFLNNLESPVILVNDILQVEPGRALDTTYRFVINTTVGVGGLFDAAEYFGLERHDEDFGQTLGTWGVEPGPYLVLPLLGPSNPRDLTGTIVDRVFDPFTWAEFEGDDEFRIASGVIGGINARSGAQNAIDQLRSQPEPYTALKRIYVSNRESEIENGREDQDSFEYLPDFESFD